MQKDIDLSKLQQVYSKYFSLGYLNTDISNKFALISLICFVTYKLQQKNSNITHYQVIKKIIKDELPEDFVKGLSVVCSDFSYSCTTFPTFNIEPKDMPKKIKEILANYLPF